MKRTPLKRKMPLKRSKPLRKRSPTNSQPQRNPKLIEEYKRDNPACELCGSRRNLELCHCLAGHRRWDVRSNIFVACSACHQGLHAGIAESNMAGPYDAEILCLWRKLQKGEFDPRDFDYLGTEGIRGQLHRYGERESVRFERMRLDLLRACG